MIQRLEIRNLGGIQDFVLEPKSLTVIQGDNAEGKSSILAALHAVFEGGHDPSLIRTGAKKAEVEITLHSGAVIRKVITAKGTSLAVSDPDGRPVAKPQTYVDSLAGGFGFDPLAFVRATPKERLEFLLRALPVKFDGSEFGTGELDLAGLDALEKAKREERKEANRRWKDAESTARELTRGLPPEDEKNWASEEKLARLQLDELRAAVNEDITRIADEARAAEHAVLNEINAKMDALAKEREVAIAGIRAYENGAKAGIKEKAEPAIRELSDARAQAAERADAQSRAAGTRDLIAKHRAKVKEYGGAAARLDLEIERIGERRRKALETLPIDGMDIRDGELFIGGLPFDRLNTGEQYLRSFEIGALSPCGLMIADGAECLGPTNWAMFQRAALESGYQIMAARVTPGPLVVITEATCPA